MFDGGCITYFPLLSFEKIHDGDWNFNPCLGIALLWRAQMLCWLAFGEHEALKRDMKGAGILIPAQGIPTSTARLYPTEIRANPFRRPSMGGSNALPASIC